MAVIVERRDAGHAIFYGAAAGAVAGLLLGVSAIVSTLALGGPASEPFRFVAAFVVGDEAFGPDFSPAAAILLGTTIHFALSVLYGMVYVGLLALTFQLSARAWLLVIYGSLFAFVVWEVSFLAMVPALFPNLVGELDLATQVWTGVASYCGVYGPALGVVTAILRPGVVDSWRGLRAPAGTFTAPTTPRERR